MKRVTFGLLLILSSLFFSCSSFRQNIMFKVPKDFHLKQQVEAAEHNYTIRSNDLLKLEVYTNKGERIIDPNYEASKDLPPSVPGLDKTKNDYLVDIHGKVNFPLIGDIKVDSLTIRQAQDLLQKEFSKYYQDPFVVLKFSNKRVTILGATGGLLLPLANDNTRLTEILAMARGIPSNGKAWNIRVLRGDNIYVADLSTIDGYLKNNIIIEPNDIIYVEPVQRPVSEAVREYGGLISIVTSLATLIIVLTRL